jgi:hypothetical protein
MSSFSSLRARQAGEAIPIPACRCRAANEKSLIPAILGEGERQRRSSEPKNPSLTLFKFQPWRADYSPTFVKQTRNKTARPSSRCLEDRPLPTSNNMKPIDDFYQRLQPDFLAGFFAAAFLVDRLAGLRALFFALRTVFFLRVAMIPPSGMLGIIIGEKMEFNASDLEESFWPPTACKN